MKKRIKSKTIELKYFIIPFLLIILAYSYLIYGTMVSWIKNNYDFIRADAINVARVYSHNLNKSTKAKELLYDLIDERLLMASSALSQRTEGHSNELLGLLARELNVDVIYSYDSNGVIQYDSSNEYIGWKAPEGHPVYAFLHSGEKYHVEEVRKDSESERFYKYSYTRLSDGRFFQVGVSAENIQGFLKDFEMEQLLSDIGKSYTVDFAHFIGTDNVIKESTIESFKGVVIEDKDLLQAIYLDQEYEKTSDVLGVKSFQVYVPVYMDEVKIGTLAIGQNTESFFSSALGVIGKGTGVLLSIITVMGILIIITYNKSKNHLNLAYYDTLTNLPNDVYMKEYLSGKISQKKIANKAIFLINMRNFRTINIALGFEVGDLIIKEISQRLEAALDKKGMLFRFTGDRFVFYVEGYQNAHDLEIMSQIITSVFDRPFEYLRKNKQIIPEIGIVEISDRYRNVDDLMKDASITITYMSSGVCNHMIFNAEMRNQVEREEVIELELVRSYKNLKDDIIHLEYQPKINAKTNQIVGFEALARMNSKKLGFVSPTEFIDIAEKKQLILPLGTMILEKACIFTRKLVSQGYRDIRVAVNVSGIQLLMDDFIDTVSDIITRTGIQTRNLELEITETILLENYAMINDVLQSLRNMGIEISMDDFGTGFSSLASIGELNIDIVKIDRHFITKIITGSERNLITNDIISMAHKLGLQVIAEGVETGIQREYLMKNGCEIMQGYYFSRPLPEDKAIAMLRATL
ncbi:GGDEF domain-containing phosphodiesterase [Proteiniclasticum sp.]|uniref:putative bifunctional diguanylate cyclase/phosphodiesterase n=1 Tax=Proteiniclasticum sp. TaxID=2053595 RepID=UPI002899A625|nr:GGDEF domain-containing phosphodiesterase [Proteiniclasticum sp.]